MNKQARGLLKENIELSKQLEPSYEKVLTDIICYIRFANISDYQQERIRRDITHMMVDGSHRGDPIESVIGEDYKAFCDNVLAEVPPMKTKEKVISVFSSTCLYLSVMFAICLYSGLLDMIIGITIWPYFPMTVGNLIGTFLIICFSIAYGVIIAKNSFAGPLSKIKILLIFTTLFTIILFINIYFKVVLISIHAAVAIIMILGLFTTYKLLDLREEPTEEHK